MISLLAKIFGWKVSPLAQSAIDLMHSDPDGWRGWSSLRIEHIKSGVHVRSNLFGTNIDIGRTSVEVDIYDGFVLDRESDIIKNRIKDRMCRVIQNANPRQYSPHGKED